MLRYDRAVSSEARYEVNKPEVVDESVDGEVLIVHLGTGAYFSARGAGDVAWQLIASGATSETVASVLGAKDGGAATCEGVDGFVGRLLEEGLIRPRTAEPKPAPVFATVPAGEPLLEKFTDMQDLLLLDPIHDVEEEGWPNAKPLAGTSPA
jgi:hypothetical protein